MREMEAGVRELDSKFRMGRNSMKAKMTVEEKGVSYGRDKMRDEMSFSYLG
jgi:hypothetical protein